MPAVDEKRQDGLNACVRLVRPYGAIVFALLAVRSARIEWSALMLIDAVARNCTRSVSAIAKKSLEETKKIFIFVNKHLLYFYINF